MAELEIVVKSHALNHGVDEDAIYGALEDSTPVYLTTEGHTEMRFRFVEGGEQEVEISFTRYRLLAQDRPHGPYLHILFDDFGDRIEVFHAREMVKAEKQLYQSRRDKGRKRP